MINQILKIVLVLSMFGCQELLAQEIIQTIEGYQLQNSKGKILTDIFYDDMGWSDDANPESKPFFYGQLIGVQLNGKWGLINTKGKEVVSPKYQTINYFTNGISIISENGRFGAMNTSGKEIVPLTFSKLKMMSGNLEMLVASSNGLQGVIDFKGNTILPIEYISIQWAGPKLLAAMNQKGEWELVYHDGTPYSKERYTSWKWLHQPQKLLLDINGRKGLLDNQTVVEYEVKYKSISFTDSTCIVDTYPTYVLGTLDGTSLSTWNCDSIQYASDTLIRYFVEDKVGVATIHGRNQFFNFYDVVGDFVNGQAIVQKKNRFGVCDTYGKLIIPLKFNNIKRMPTGHYWTLDETNFTDIYDHKGKNITYHNYDMVGEYSQGKYLVRKARRYGYLDSNLKEWISPQFTDAESFVGPYAVVRTNDYYGVIDLNRKWVISPVVDRLKTISEGLYYFEDNQKWGTLSAEGYEWYRTDDATVESFEDGYVIMKKRGKYGLLTNQGELCLNTLYDSLEFSNLDEGRVNMYIDSTWLYKDVYDDEGEPKRNAYQMYEEVGVPHEGFTEVKMRDKYGFMDYLGRMRLTIQYEAVKHFSEGVAPFQLNNKWGFIDKEDRIYLQPRYEELFPLINNMSKAKKNGYWGVIDRNGEVVIPFKYEAIERTSFGNWYVWEKGGKMGIYEPGGTIGIYGKYTSIKDLGIDYVIVSQDKLLGVDKINGLVSWGQKYYQISLLSNKKWFALTTSLPSESIKSIPVN
ncbi:WG repeat-containing protein [Flammeovirga agarivorans]|uniref:WG repeat-containing protein n=1 Tax=Flammeovirga agarivorans TaxID=2726742 RepID=A0A7X8SRM9_9BACT|nr:WG repeat-containing protein [Flammeovirga agarivorans]NLR95004.1 WG repeat-containing protein [Flammeovirga agarivorans]